MTLVRRLIVTALAVVGSSVPATAAPNRLGASIGRADSLRVGVGDVARSIPDSYLGFSVEWTELPAFESDTSAFARVLGRLSVAGQPVPLRVGGETADNTYLPRANQRVPPRGYVVGGDYFARVGALARAARVGLLFDVNLAARSPQMAQALARGVRRAVPSGSVAGFEIGNEPDLYRIGVIGNQFVKPATSRGFRWALGYGAADYAADFGRYVGALRAVWPRVRYAGPAVISGRMDFGERTLRTGMLSMLTVHRYQFSACTGPSGSTYPSLRKYLSLPASRAFAARTRPLVALAHGAHVPLRIGEFGSAICGGRAGLTNTYATALWAANTIFNLIAQGVDGVNVHLRVAYPNSALNASSAGITANPLYYGMLLVTKTLGSGAQLLNVSATPASANVAIWAVRDRHRTTRVLLLNEGNRSVRTTVALRTAGHGIVQRLTAPAPDATTNVQFAGQSLNAAGNWTGTSDTESVNSTHGSFRITLPPYTATLLTAAPL